MRPGCSMGLNESKDYSTSTRRKQYDELVVTTLARLVDGRYEDMFTGYPMDLTAMDEPGARKHTHIHMQQCCP